MGYYVGTNGNDNIVGSAYDDQIYALGGSDRITGARGADEIVLDLTKEGEDTVIYNTLEDSLSNSHDNIHNFKAFLNGQRDYIDLSALGVQASDIVIESYSQSAPYVGAATAPSDPYSPIMGTGFPAMDYPMYDSPSYNDPHPYMDPNGTGYDPVAGAQWVMNIVTIRGTDFKIVVYANDNLTLENFVFSDGAAVGNTGGGAGDNDPAYLIATPYDDVLIGTENNDVIDALAGNDFVRARDGNDFVDGNEGKDTLDGGAGDDMLIGGLDDDELHGDDGNDVLWADDGNFTHRDGNDTVFGGAGNDQLHGMGGDDSLDGGLGRDIIVGAGGDDVLFGGEFAAEHESDKKQSYPYNYDKLYGNDGNDYLSVVGGANELYGGNDNDTLIGGADDDYMTGGRDDDSMEGGAGNDVMYGGHGPLDPAGTGAFAPVEMGNDTLNGNAGNDTVIGSDSGFSIVRGGQGNDLVRSAPDYVTDSGGDIIGDELFGDAGNDTVLGANGDDTLRGGSGDDILDAGRSQADGNILTGGSGADLFLFKSAYNNMQTQNELMGGADVNVFDTITDYEVGIDRIGIYPHLGWQYIGNDTDNSVLIQLTDPFAAFGLDGGYTHTIKVEGISDIADINISGYWF